MENKYEVGDIVFYHVGFEPKSVSRSGFGLVIDTTDSHCIVITTDQKRLVVNYNEVEYLAAPSLFNELDLSSYVGLYLNSPKFNSIVDMVASFLVKENPNDSLSILRSLFLACYHKLNAVKDKKLFDI